MHITPQDAEAVARDELHNAIADAASGGPPGHHHDVYALVDAYREAIERRVLAERPALPADVQAVVERLQTAVRSTERDERADDTPRLVMFAKSDAITLLAHLKRDTP